MVEAGRTRLLLDCGFGPRDLVRRLARVGLAPTDLDAILVTHEHSDHIAGVGRVAARHGLPVYLTHGTRAASRWTDEVRAEIFECRDSFAIGDLEISPFPVPHDAREPTQFVFSDGRRRLGVVTDAGYVTPHMERMLSRCDGLVLECNHDADLLARGSYPWPLKQRIAGLWGHLDNTAAAALLRTVGHAALQHVVAAHLSQENNTPALARAALAGVLNCQEHWVGIADQEAGFDWRQLS